MGTRNNFSYSNNDKPASTNRNSDGLSNNPNPYFYGAVTFVDNITRAIQFTTIKDNIGTDKIGNAMPAYKDNITLPQVDDVVPLFTGLSPDANVLGEQYTQTIYYLNPISTLQQLNENPFFRSGTISFTPASINPNKQDYKAVDLGFVKTNTGITTNIKPKKNYYPHLPFTPLPPATVLSYKYAVGYLNKKYPKALAKGTFALMLAEASRDGGNFVSPGGNNYAGVQTDVGVWGAKGIIGQYRKIDSGKKDRAFAMFASNDSFLDFTANRVLNKNLLATSADNWAANYILSWWSPAEKHSYIKGTPTYTAKIAIFNTASQLYDKLA